MRSAFDAARNATASDPETVAQALLRIKRSCSPQFCQQEPLLTAYIITIVEAERSRILGIEGKRHREEEEGEEMDCLPNKVQRTFE